jgi:hypothetical protein
MHYRTPDLDASIRESEQRHHGECRKRVQPVLQSQNRSGHPFRRPLERKHAFLLPFAGQDEQVSGFRSIELIE